MAERQCCEEQNISSDSSTRPPIMHDRLVTQAMPVWRVGWLEHRIWGKNILVTYVKAEEKMKPKAEQFSVQPTLLWGEVDAASTHHWFK